MSKLKLSIVFIFVCLFSNAQSFSNASVINQVGTTGNILRNHDMTTDTDGNLISVGIFNGIVDFDPSNEIYSLADPLNYGNLFVLKLNAEGSFLWAKRIGDNKGMNVGKEVVTDDFGNVYVLGNMSNSGTDPASIIHDFDPGEGVFNLDYQDGSIFVLKLDPNGNFLWAKNFGLGAFGQSLSIDSEGNLYVGGTNSATTDFDPTNNVYNLTCASPGCAFFSKFDSDGNFIWAKGFADVPGSRSYLRKILVDTFDDILITGYFYDNIDFDPSENGIFELTSNFFSNDIYLCKLDSNGEFIYAKRIGSNSNEEVSNVVSDSFGNVYFDFYTSVGTDVDPNEGVFNMGNNKRGLLKLNQQGQFLWAKALNKNSTEFRDKTIDVDAQGNIYLAGDFSGTRDFDPGPNEYLVSVNNSGNDNYFLKLNTDGEFVWFRTFNTVNSNESIDAIHLDANGYLYGTGSFVDTVDFDLSEEGVFNLTASNRDVYILKFNPSTLSIDSVDENKLLAYPNPFNNQIKLFFDNEYDQKKILVYDLRGKLVQKLDTKESFIEIGETYEGGVYIVKIELLNETKNIKIMKQ